jgi:hypothetical protein
MKSRARFRITLVALLVFCVSFSFAATTVYRGCAASRNGKALTGPTDFRIDEVGDKLELSTFDAAHQNGKPCQLGFLVNDDGSVQQLSGYTAQASDSGDGHWSILLPHGTTRDQAKADFSSYARSAQGQALMNPNGCRK